jgi:Protein of unknown function (DUF2800)
MEEGLPEEDSEQSREGILLHDYAAHPEYDHAFLSDMQRRLLELSDTLVKQVIDQIESQYNLKQGVVQFIEHPIAYHGELDHLTGRPDIVRLYAKDKSILVIDRKFGYNIVERAELNLQLRAYAVMANYSWAEGDLFAHSSVAIVQPRMSYDERITIADYLPEETNFARTQIFKILERTKDPEAPLRASEEACRYCKAKLICPEFRKMLDQPLVTFRTDGEWTVAKRAEYIEHRLAQCTDQDLDKLLQAIGLAVMVKESANDEARKRIQDGRLPTHMLGKESKVRSIADVRRAFALLSLSRIQTTEQLMELITLPIKPIEEAYRVATGCTGKEARDKINQVLSSVIKRDTRKARVIKK